MSYNKKLLSQIHTPLLKAQKGKEIILPKAQLGLLNPVDMGMMASKVMNFFGMNKPKIVTTPASGYTKLNIRDPRKIMMTTGKPLRPNSDLVNGDYETYNLDNLINEAKRNKMSYDNMMNLATMGFQETKWGREDGNNIGHVKNARDFGSTDDSEGSNYTDFINAYNAKMKEADRLKIKDEATRLQVYNGLGKVFPSTEDGYHGFKMKKIYGVPVPKGGIDLKKNPLYGKQIIDLRENVLKKSPEFMRYIDSAYNAPMPADFGYGGQPCYDCGGMYADGGPIEDPMGQWAHPGEITRIPGNRKNNITNITMKGVNYPVLGIGSNGQKQMMYPNQEYSFGGAEHVDEYPMMGNGGEMIRRADGSYSHRGLWNNIRANKGSGKKPSKEMLEQERKIKAKNMEYGGTNNPGFEALPEYVQAKILSNMGYGGYYNPMMATGGERMPPEIARARFAAAGNLDQMSNYGYAYGGNIPEMGYGGYDYMAEGGEPNGGMALGQMMAVADKMSKLRQFVSPDKNLDPWIASKLAVMDESADAISDYMMYNPEAQEMQEGISEMGNGGYTVTRSNDRKGKTHKVTGPDGTVKYFGDSNLGQHPKDPKRKAAFYARHKHNLDNNPFFRAFARKTWEDGGQPDLPLAQRGWVERAANAEYSCDANPRQQLRAARAAANDEIETTSGGRKDPDRDVKNARWNAQGAQWKSQGITKEDFNNAFNDSSRVSNSFMNPDNARFFDSVNGQVKPEYESIRNNINPRLKYYAQAPGFPMGQRPTVNNILGLQMSQPGGMEGYRELIKNNYAGNISPFIPVRKQGGSTFSGNAFYQDGGYTSVADYAKASGRGASYKERKAMAESMGISGYRGTEDQNMQLLNMLKSQDQQARYSPADMDNSEHTETPDQIAARVSNIKSAYSKIKNNASPIASPTKKTIATAQQQQKPADMTYEQFMSLANSVGPKLVSQKQVEAMRDKNGYISEIKNTPVSTKPKEDNKTSSNKVIKEFMNNIAAGNSIDFSNYNKPAVVNSTKSAKDEEAQKANDAIVMNYIKRKEKESDSRYLESGMIADKGTNTMHVVQNGKVVKSFPVLTGKSRDANENTKGVKYLDSHPEERATPVGSYMSSYANDVYGAPGFYQTGIPAFGADAPLAKDIATHVTYPGDFKRRNALYDQPANKRNASYGCINCKKPDIEYLTNMFPKGDTTMVIDSRKGKDAKFLKNTYGVKAYGGNVNQMANGGIAKGQEMEVTPEEAEILRQQGYQFEII